MYGIAVCMLMKDRIKFIMLVASLTFVVALVVQQGSMFCGVMLRLVNPILMTQAPIWVMNRATEIFDVPTPVPYEELNRVLSMDGVEWAAPYRYNLVLVKMASGKYHIASLIGLDGETLIGRPRNMVAGNIQSLNEPNSILLASRDLDKLENPQIGGYLEINESLNRVAGIVETPKNFFSYPVIFTTFDRSFDFAPSRSKSLSYILVKPQPGISEQVLADRINRETDLLALTEENFCWKSMGWYFKNTLLPLTFAMMMLLGMIFGAAISAQIFYTLTAENIRYFAVFKALGAQTSILENMVLVQSVVAGMIGYGIGIGISAIFGNMVPSITELGFYTPYQLLILTFVAIVGMCVFASHFSISKIRSLEPALAFRV